MRPLVVVFLREDVLGDQRVLVESLKQTVREAITKNHYLMTWPLAVTEADFALLTAREAAKYLRVSMFTLSKIERGGGLIPYRTPGGHRRYSIRMLNAYLDESRRLPKDPSG